MILEINEMSSILCKTCGFMDHKLQNRDVAEIFSIAVKPTRTKTRSTHGASSGIFHLKYVFFAALKKC